MTIPEGTRRVNVIGFSAGSYSGLALRSILCEFACFPGYTKVAATAAPAGTSAACYWRTQRDAYYPLC